MAIIHFFKVTYYSIFNHLFVDYSKNKKFFSLIFTYFCTIKTNN